MTPDFEVSVATEIKEIKEKKTLLHRPEITGLASAVWRRWSPIWCHLNGAESLSSPTPK